MAHDELERLAEDELVAAFRRTGDGRWFAELYRRERRAVFAVCLRYLRDPAQAEETCHDAFLRAFERWASFTGERFGPWVRSIAVHLSLDRLRRESTRREPLPDGSPSEPPPPDREAVSRQELAAARDIIAALEPGQRAVFLLRHLDGLGHREIGAITGLDSEAVRSRLQNARRNFRLAWQDRAARATGKRHG